MASLYEQGKVHHVGVLSALENEQCSWTPDVDESPNRCSADRAPAKSSPRLRGPIDWRTFFAVSLRVGAETRLIFEGRKKYTFHPQAGGGYPLTDFLQVSNGTWNDLVGLIDDGIDDVDDAIVASSLSGARFMPMPPSLARYALMFYVSSLVRYKPDQLDPRFQPEQHWLLSAFIDQARTQLLRSALSGIRNRRHMFHSPLANRG